MPLHLLPKKSWNPYSSAAIERVRRDEEAADEADRRRSERLNAHEAAVRIAILRGETPPELSPEEEDVGKHGDVEQDGERRRQDRLSRQNNRRRPGEDDTDRDVRVARERLDQRQDESSADQKHKSRSGRPEGISRDGGGHLVLFSPPSPPPKNSRSGRQGADGDAGMGMQFRHAAGYKSDPKTRPWYNNSGAEQVGAAGLARDDEEQKEQEERNAARARREQRRVAAADPMAAMKQGQARLKTVERERAVWRAERAEELAQLREHQDIYAQRRRERPRLDEIEEFSLDVPALPLPLDSRSNGHATSVRLERDRERDRDSRSRRHHHHHSHSRGHSHSKHAHRKSRRSRSPDRDRERRRHDA